jgi:hypothetical protein
VVCLSTAQTSMSRVACARSLMGAVICPTEISPLTSHQACGRGNHAPVARVDERPPPVGAGGISWGFLTLFLPFQATRKALPCALTSAPYSRSSAHQYHPPFTAVGTASVLFRQPGSGSEPGRTNFPPFRSLQTLDSRFFLVAVSLSHLPLEP